MNVVVLWWEYTDKSASGIIGVYADFDEGGRMLKLLEEHASDCSKSWKLTCVPFEARTLEAREEAK